MSLHQELLTAIATGIDRHIAQRQPLPLAREPWAAAEARIAQAARKQRNRNTVLAIIIFIAFAALIGLIIVAEFP